MACINPAPDVWQKSLLMLYPNTGLLSFPAGGASISANMAIQFFKKKTRLVKCHIYLENLFFWPLTLFLLTPSLIFYDVHHIKSW